MNNNIIEYQPRKPIFKPKTTLRTETHQTIRLLIGTLGAMIVILIVSFFALTNASAQKGYTLQQAQLQNQELKDQQESLTARITEIASFTKLQTTPTIENMQMSENVQYITRDDNKI